MKRHKTLDVETVAMPEVGRRYSVPCIYATDWKCWLPIFGPIHEDKEFIQFPDQHWHIDWR